MHRSGTSALARAINVLGADLPARLMPAREGNEHGHWEPEYLVDLNDSILSELDSRWCDCRSVNLGKLAPGRSTELEQQLANAIEEDYGTSELFVVKDPRICRLLPLWLKALPRANASSECCIIFRHPYEVAKSLEKRNSLPFHHGCLLWLRHVLEAEFGSRGLTRVFVDYEDLVRDPEGVAKRIDMEFIRTFPESGDARLGQAGSAINPALRHHVAAHGDIGESTNFLRWLKVAFEAHLLLTGNPNDFRAQELLDGIARDVAQDADGFAAMLANGEAALRTRDLALTTDAQALPVVKAELEALHRKLDQTQRLLEASRAAENRRVEENNELRAAMEAIFSTTTWRMARPFRGLERALRSLKQDAE